MITTHKATISGVVAFFKEAESYRRYRGLSYASDGVRLVEALEAADDVHGYLRGLLGLRAEDRLAAYWELWHFAKDRSEEIEEMLANPLKLFATKAADAICDALDAPPPAEEVEPPPPVVEESPLASAVEAMRGEHPLSSNVSHDDAKACDECGAFHSYSTTCTADALAVMRAIKGGSIVVVDVDEAVAPCADPAGMGEF